MCGIVGVVSNAPVNQLIYDALLLLQHRGQDAAGIVTQQERKFFMHKAKGMVRDVFRTRNMRALPGTVGLAGAGGVPGIDLPRSSVSRCGTCAAGWRPRASYRRRANPARCPR